GGCGQGGGGSSRTPGAAAPGCRPARPAAGPCRATRQRAPGWPHRYVTYHPSLLLAAAVRQNRHNLRTPTAEAGSPTSVLGQLGDYFCGEALSVLGLVEQRREQDQFRARSGNLAQLAEAVGERGGDGGRLDAFHALPVKPLQRLVRPAAGARRVLVDRHVDAFGNLEVRDRTARLLQSAAHRLDLFCELGGGRRARAEETVALPHGTPQRGRSGSPEPQRRIRLLERLGVPARGFQLPDLPPGRPPLPRPERPHQPDALREPRPAP